MNEKHFDAEVVDFSGKQGLVNGKLLVQTGLNDVMPEISDVMLGHGSHSAHSSS